MLQLTIQSMGEHVSIFNCDLSWFTLRLLAFIQLHKCALLVSTHVLCERLSAMQKAMIRYQKPGGKRKKIQIVPDLNNIP